MNNNLPQPLSEADAFQHHARRMKFFPSADGQTELSPAQLPTTSYGNGQGLLRRENVQTVPPIYQRPQDIIPTRLPNMPHQPDQPATAPLAGSLRPENRPTSLLGMNQIRTARLNMPTLPEQVKTTQLDGASTLPTQVKTSPLNMPVLPEQAKTSPLNTHTQSAQAKTGWPPPSPRPQAVIPSRPIVPPRPSIEARDQAWKPGTFGFENVPELGTPSAFKKEDTFPMMVLKGIAQQQGKDTPVMQAEIVGAASGAATAGLGTILANVFKYGNNLLIQRGFGSAGYGLYTLGYSLASLGWSVFNLGLDNSMIRYTSVYRGKKQPRFLQGLTLFCSALVALAGLLGGIIVLYMAPYLAALRHSNDVVPILEMMVPLIPLMCIQLIWSAGLQGFKDVKWRVLTYNTLIPGILFFLLIFVLIFFHTLTGVIVALLLSTIITTAITLWALLRRVRQVITGEPEKYALREWLGYAIPNFLTSTVDTVMNSIGTLLLAAFIPQNSAIGQYGAAVRISIFIGMPLQSLNIMFTPIIAELHSKGEKQKLAAMFKVVTKWTITFSLPIFWIAALFSWAIMRIPGNDFAQAWPVLVVFSLGAIANAGTGCVGYMLLMTGHQKLSFLNSLAAIVSNVVFGIILTPRFGVLGVAIATALAIAVVNFMRLIQVYVFLKIQPYRWDTLKPVLASVLSAAITGTLIYLVSLTHLSLDVAKVQFSIELLLIPVFLAGYGAFLFLFKFGPEDQIVINALRKKLGRGKKKPALGVTK